MWVPLNISLLVYLRELQRKPRDHISDSQQLTFWMWFRFNNQHLREMWKKEVKQKLRVCCSCWQAEMWMELGFCSYLTLGSSVHLVDSVLDSWVPRCRVLVHFVGMHPSKCGMVPELAAKVAPWSWPFPHCRVAVLVPDHRRGSSSLRA